jgi:3-deoxy-D-manno-octulosonate 8-phosphate phosphatase KdsC-like HAD superfamily phosphatase
VRSNSVPILLYEELALEALLGSSAILTGITSHLVLTKAKDLGDKAVHKGVDNCFFLCRYLCAGCG